MYRVQYASLEGRGNEISVWGDPPIHFDTPIHVTYSVVGVLPSG